MLAAIGDNKKGADVSVKNQEHVPLTWKILDLIPRHPYLFAAIISSASFAALEIMNKPGRLAKKLSAKKKKRLAKRRMK